MFSAFNSKEAKADNEYPLWKMGDHTQFCDVVLVSVIGNRSADGMTLIADGSDSVESADRAVHRIDSADPTGCRSGSALTAKSWLWI